MTVVLGQHFFQGVVMVADSRSSIEVDGEDARRRDNAQKIFFLTPNIIIGFAGDIRFASAIIPFLINQLQNRPRLRPINIFAEKGPKLVGYAYRELSKVLGDCPVGFIVAGMDFTRPAPIKDANGEITGHMGIFDKKIFKILSPLFLPEHITIQNPFVIMGSGQKGIEGLEASFKDMQFGQVLPTLDFQAHLIALTLKERIKSLGISSVGGLFQVAVIDNHGPRFLPYKTKRDLNSPGDEMDVELLFRNGRFVQKDLKTGKEIELLFPAEVLKIEEDESDLFAELNAL